VAITEHPIDSRVGGVAWEQLAEQQLAAREAVCNLLDHPSVDAVHAALVTSTTCLQLEAELCDRLDEWGDLAVADGTLGYVVRLRDGQRDFIAALNSVSWDVPGTASMTAKALRLRRLLLGRIESTQRLRHRSGGARAQSGAA
jgi:hypothetical protein